MIAIAAPSPAVGSGAADDDITEAVVREGILYRQLSSGRVQCDVCLLRCHIASGHTGRCHVRLNRDGKLYALSYGQVAAAHVDPIEKKPLFHFYPGSKVFSLGSVGCNFRCIHCQNWSIAYAQPRLQQDGAALTWQSNGYAAEQPFFCSPEEAVAAALRAGCTGICWTYNEPTVWFEYALDCAKIARERGLYTAFVTNGYLTPDALDAIGPYLDCFRVDFKGFSSGLYRRLAKIPHWDSMLDVAKRAKERWNMHVEVVTNVIPTLNDDDAQLSGIAQWVATNLGSTTAWHVTAFHPDATLRDVPPTPLSTLLRARDIGRAAGLRFVYLGNVVAAGGEDTRCPRCDAVAVERRGYHTTLLGVTRGGLCAGCGCDLQIRGLD